MNRILKRLLAVMLVFSMLFVNFAYAGDSELTEEELLIQEQERLESERQEQMATELRDRYESLQASLSVIQNQLESTQAQKNYAINKRAAVKAEISLIQEQLDNLNEQMTLLNEKITAHEIDIVNKEMEIEESQVKFEYRLVANQTAGNSDIWSILFSSGSFSGFLTSLETIIQFAEYDTKLIKALKEDKKELEELKVSLNKDKEELDEVIAQANEKRATLDKKYTQLNGQVYSLDALAKQYKENKEAIEQSMADAQAELDAFYLENMLAGNYVGGSFAYPVLPANRYISSYYGNRTFDDGYKDFHTGIDFTGGGCYGAPIMASNAGTVTFVKTTYVPGKGYGKYLIVDHGGGKSTLYAHCSSIAVSVGQRVMQGQTIAYIGSTGFSTGAHLHFEIRINGKHVNPLPYLTGQSK